MDDDGAPIAMDDVPERSSFDLGSPVRNFNFSIPFFQQFVETGDGDDWSDDEDDKMLTPKLKNIHSMWKTTPNPQSASNEPDQGYADEPPTPTSPLSAGFSAFVFPSSPRTPRSPTSADGGAAAAQEVLSFTEPIVDDDVEPAEDYRKGGYHPLEAGEMLVESRTGQKDDIRRKYIAERKLGWGVYSTVWLAKEVVKKSSKTAAPRFAIKIQKSAKEYSRAAQNEIMLLKKIKETARREKATKLYLVQLLRYFELEGPNGSHVCMVFEPLGHSLLGLLQVSPQGCIQPVVTAHVVAQLLKGLAFLHEVCCPAPPSSSDKPPPIPGIMHTDVKPENVLLVPGSSAMCPEIKIVDFGNACQCSLQHAKAIQTREYRSPEALLGAWPYTTAVDLWSVGAMIFELLTGEILFDANRPRPTAQTTKDEMHLAEIMFLLGPIPIEVVEVGHYSHNWFDIPQTARLREKKINCKHDPMQIENRLRQTVPPDEIPLVAAMIRQALVYEPSERATASELLNAEWLALHLNAEERSI